MNDWRAQAACSGLYGLMFPGRGENRDNDAAKALCRTCPVREACLEYAMAENEQNGIWGGLSERERRKLRSKRAHEIGHAVRAERKQADDDSTSRRRPPPDRPGGGDEVTGWMVERAERLRRHRAALAIPDEDEAMAG